MHMLVSKRSSIATPNGTPTIQTNGHPLGTSKSTQFAGMSPKERLREVKSSLLIVMEAISRTVNSARDVFQSQKSTQPALAFCVLEQMHAESPAVSEPEAALPSELALNTQTILAELPSSSYFALLPTSIRSYKPYVELSSASSSVPGNFLEDKLRNWFDQSCSTLRDALDRWLLELDSAKSVWTVRSSLRKWLLDSGLVNAEQVTLHNFLEEAVRKRLTAIWTNIIYHAKELFLKALSSLNPDSEILAEGMYLGALLRTRFQRTVRRSEFSPLSSIYVSPSVPAPPLSGSGPSAYELPYQKYRAALQLQLRGRTPRLQAFLSILEEPAALLQKDYTHMSSEESSRYVHSCITLHSMILIKLGI